MAYFYHEHTSSPTLPTPGLGPGSKSKSPAVLLPGSRSHRHHSLIYSLYLSRSSHFMFLLHCSRTRPTAFLQYIALSDTVLSVSPRIDKELGSDLTTQLTPNHLKLSVLRIKDRVAILPKSVISSKAKIADLRAVVLRFVVRELPQLA
jgi:hypothetical protein